MNRKTPRLERKAPHHSPGQMVLLLFFCTPSAVGLEAVRALLYGRSKEKMFYTLYTRQFSWHLPCVGDQTIIGISC